MPKRLRATVVSHTITGDGTVVVTVACPTCKVPRGRNAGKPKTHVHGWTRTSGEDGGHRAPHCGTLDAPSYRLRWEGGPTPEAVAALLERQHETAARHARRLSHAR